MQSAPSGLKALSLAFFLLSGFVLAAPNPIVRRISSAGGSAFTAQGCFTDSASDRALKDCGTHADDMTIEQCSVFCADYKFFGVEYGKECYCGNVKADSSAPVDIGDCSFECAGDASENCGAGDRINILLNNNFVPPANPSLSAFEFKGCLTDSASRALQGDSFSDPDMTVEKCAAHCSSFQYFGVEFGTECYCGNTILSGDYTSASDCSMLCPGLKSEFCGAANRLTLYGKTSTVTAPPTAPSPSIGGYQYSGCFSDSASNRVLAAKRIDIPQMSLQSCLSACSGYPYFGVEYGTECYCGNQLAPTAIKQFESDCSFQCPAVQSQSCGAGGRINVYQNPNVVLSHAVTTLKNFTYTGCRVDSVSSRVLGGPSTSSSSMSVDICASTCASYKYFGVEYGTECYCGNTLAYETIAAEADCSTHCAGDYSELCGAPGRISLYTAKPVAPACQSTNLLTNGAFDDSLTGWQQILIQGGDHIDYVTDGCRSGSGCAAYYAGNTVTKSAMFNTKVGTSYQVSYWAKAIQFSQNGLCNAIAETYDSSNNFINFACSVLTQTSGYLQCKGQFTARTTQSYIWIYVSCGFEGGKVLVDDAQVSEICP